jgi:predicted hotdog family 3-hydroxylacyl-ACP dehydratase
LVPVLLDHAGIAARIPHQGGMVLLQALHQCTADTIVCSASSHQDPANPLRTGGVLWAAASVEYASQAMALHGVLSAAEGRAPRAGFLASVRGVNMRVPRLDTVSGDLRVQAHRQVGDERQASYRFAVHSAAGALLVEGRASVILDAWP